MYDSHNALQILSIISFCLFLSACPYQDQIDDLNKQLAQANETARKYNETAQQYKEQWNKFGTQMVDATDKLDPLVLKEMFRKNESLEAANAELQKKLSNTAAGGTCATISSEEDTTKFLSLCKSVILRSLGTLPSC